MKDLNSRVKGGKIHLKSFLCSGKALLGSNFVSEVNIFR